MMLKADLADAGIAYVDESGYVADFHALRHSFLTLLAAGGVHPKMAQTLARHSDINLTLSRYTHTVLSDEADALSALPSLPSPFDEPQQDRQVMRATGTEDVRLGGQKSGPENRPELGAFQGDSVHLHAPNTDEKPGRFVMRRETKKPDKPRRKQGFSGSSSSGEGGIL